MNEDVPALLAEKLLGEQFSCVAGKTAWLRGAVVHRHHGRLATAATTSALHEDLVSFVARMGETDESLVSLITTFDGPLDVGEVEFERLVWDQLQRLHEHDITRFPWPDLADPDPASPTFGYGVAGHAFFVVGLHSRASRISRRFAYPALVWNSHAQFERLKERGIYQRIQRQVRANEMLLQGSLNPNLADFGQKSEAAQYSGRAVEPDWRCPFHARVTGEEPEERS